ncbi:MAG: HPr-rel-A system PqqD family peptide chaperone [Propionivibrio sp.]|nr:HPr-rel-A system PqqD family peptide chaperone [Propionivibrio sp.]MBP6709719.1 HPr-rel-A system PqqD family peptide chaperone [Propionivibrio sp.]MBP7524147.1 HPr-rel-A system PqqD family peptide chaperone [Propionivibrio sp.]
MNQLPTDGVPKDSFWVLTSAGHALQIQKWDGLYIIFQRSSAETHAFNATTVLILKCLVLGQMSMEALRSQTEFALGVCQGDLAEEDFAFATMRLEELGLIERLDSASAVQ